MQRTKSIYEVTGVEFDHFDKETMKPVMVEKTYELENIRIKDGYEEDSIISFFSSDHRIYVRHGFNFRANI